MWSPDHEANDELYHQSCCWRPTLGDAERCVWHADPDNTGEKTISALQEARQDSNVRDRTSPVSELLDGVTLSGLGLGDSIPLSRISLRGADITEADLRDADLTSAILWGTDLTEADLRYADLTEANIRYANLTEANIRHADLTKADLSDAELTEADLSDTALTEADLRYVNLAGADLRDADLTGADLQDADLTEADLRHIDLTGAILWDADLTEAILWDADLTGTNLRDADLTEVDLSDADLTEVDLSDADLAGANFRDADLTDADLSDADLVGANLRDADLTEADLSDADLTEANLEGAKLIGANLFDATLTRITPYGARFTGAQINDGAEFHADTSEYAQWWQRGLLSPPPRCGYDPALIEDGNDDEAELTKAADTYKQFEQLASDNTLPVTESLMFVLRQDMQRRRHRMQRDPIQYVFAVISGGVFRYGESLARILTWALLFVFGYAAVYDRYNLIVTQSGGAVNSFVDALYFSTLTFTTLGLGDFKPDPTIQLARVLVTSQAALGAILIAIFVFVLGRRAAR